MGSEKIETRAEDKKSRDSLEKESLGIQLIAFGRFHPSSMNLLRPMTLLILVSGAQDSNPGRSPTERPYGGIIRKTKKRQEIYETMDGSCMLICFRLKLFTIPSLRFISS